jgi:putative colanic acid biosynthesis acetyltransferase WcaF
MYHQDLSLFKIPKKFRGRSKIFVQFWWIIYAIFFRLSPQFLYGWRRFILRSFGAKIGKKVIIRPSVQITYPWKVKIGDFCQIGDDVVLYSLGEIEIGNNVVISQRSYLCTGSHNHLKIDFPIYAEQITINEQCWLGTDVYIAPGITIGTGTVVGARSSVFKDLPPYKICFGSPVKIIKDRISEIEK